MVIALSYTCMRASHPSLNFEDGGWLECNTFEYKFLFLWMELRKYIQIVPNFYFADLFCAMSPNFLLLRDV